jgi:hypothetical protein
MPSSALLPTGTFTPLTAKNIGISSLATFSAAALGPLVLFLWLAHSSIASIKKPAPQSAFTYPLIGR